MADKKISALTGATTPLAGTEVVPLVQSSTTKKVAVDDLTVKNLRSNATTGILQVAGPAMGATRVMTTPDANFTVARTDAGQTFTGDQNVNGLLGVGSTSPAWSVTTALNLGVGSAVFNPNSTGQTWFYTNAYFNAGAKYKAAGEATWYQQVNGAHNWYGSAVGAAPGDPITFVQTGGLDNSGNLSVTGNFVVGTAGKGIDFSADPSAAGMTSELLDDYEEGTWTPAVQFDGNAVGLTYSNQVGVYTKIGRLVTVQGSIALSDKGSSTGIARIVGLPFTIASVSNLFPCFGINTFGLSATTVTVIQVSSGLQALELKIAGTDTAITNAEFTNSTQVRFALSYYA